MRQDQTTYQTFGLIIILTLCFLLPKHAFPQIDKWQLQRDSLNKLLQNTASNTDKLQTLFELSRVLHKIHPDSAVAVTKEGLELAKKIGDKNFEGIFTLREGINCQYRDFEKALELFLAANPLLTDSVYVFVNHILIGETYFELSKIDEARQYYDLALEKVVPDQIEWHAYLLNRIALMYNALNEKQSSIDYYYKTKWLYEENGMGSKAASAHTAIGNIYTSINRLDSAEWHLNLALSLVNEDNMHQNAQLLNCIGEVWRLQGKSEKAKNAFERGWQIAQNLKDTEFFSTYCVDYAYYLNETGNLQAGLEHAKLGLDVAVANGSKRDMTLAYEEMVYSLEQLNDYKKAFELQTKFIALKDSIINVENKAIINDLRLKYDTKEKEQKLVETKAKLDKQNAYNILLAALAILFIFSTILFWYFARQRKQLNSELKKIDQRKSQFFTNVSHELRTPLSLILAPLENALSKTKAPAVKKDLQLAQRNSLSLKNLIDELLDLSKLESGFVKLNYADQNIESFLKRIFSSHRSMARARDIMLEFAFYMGPDQIVRTDFNKLEKILNNLLSNAIKFCRSQGSVVMETRIKDKNIHISIRDNGIGISEDELKNIFKRYYQAPGNEKGGTGIGLAFTQELVKALGGKIHVQSELGKGSVFSFNFPFTPIETKDTSTVHGRTPSVQNNHSLPHLLVVEDNAEMADFIVQALETQYKCSIARDGQSALDIIARSKIDLITSDIMMPNMDGFEFLSKLRAEKRPDRIPVIFLSARSLESDKLKGFELGVDDYMTKPFSVKELQARIRNLLINKENRRQYKIEMNAPTVDSSYDEELLAKIKSLIEENLENSDFKIKTLAAELNYSQRQLERITKRMTGFSPNALIREIRLLRAHQLLEQQTYPTVSEVRYSVGMESASYFSKKFIERFGLSPSQLLERSKS